MPRVPSCLVVVIVVLVLCAVAPPARAQDLATNVAVYEDPTGLVSFEEARQQVYEPSGDFVNRGYTPSVFWVRLTIAAVPAAIDQPDEPGAGWGIVRMRPVFVDHVELFDPTDTSGRRRLTGDHHEWQHSEHPSLAHTFVIRVGPVPRQIWLRMKTSSAKQLHVQVLPWTAANDRDRQEELQFALLVMLLVALALAALIAAVTTQTTTDYAFAAMQAANVPYAMYVLGYLRPMTAGFVPAPALEIGFSVAVFFGVHLTCWFYYYFVHEHRPSRLGSQLVTAPLFVLPVLLLMTVAGHLETALHLNAYTSLVVPLTTLVAALSCTAWRPDSPTRPALPRWLYLGASLVSVLGSALWFVTAYGWLHSRYFLLYGMIWYTALIGTVTLTVLLIRTRRLAMMRADALRRAEIAESHVRQADRERDDEAQRLSGLTDEVRSGLSVLRMVVGVPAASGEMRAVAEQTLDSLSQALDRCRTRQAVRTADDFADTATAVLPLLEAVRAETLAPDRVIVTVEPEVPDVDTDAVTLRRLLALLVENALMHGAQDAPVDVSATLDRRQGGGVLIWISNLPGIAGWPDAGLVFTKYYRSPSARRLPGSGLGLHLAATLATQLHGQVRYAPTASHVRFVLWLPC